MKQERPVPSSVAVSDRMARARRRDTAPELAVRRILHGRGLRYRVDAPVPGLARRRADLLFSSARVAVYIDGCFWHGCPVHGNLPRANREWWRTKIDANRDRDQDTVGHLRSLGWDALRFWEHECPEEVADRVQAVVRSRSGAELH